MGIRGSFNRLLQSVKASVQRWQKPTASVPSTLRHLSSKFREALPSTLNQIKSIEPSKIFEQAKALIHEGGYGNYLRLGAAGIASYFLADTLSLITDWMIPEPPPVPAPLIIRKPELGENLTHYSAITSRNIFNSKGLIPEEGEGLAGGPARKTTLPLFLIGTVILKDELKSIATIEDRGLSMVFPARIDDVLGDKIKITKIERFRVTFLNKGTGHLEYVEIVEDAPKMSIGTTRAGTSASTNSEKGASGITQTNDNHYEIERTALDKTLSNFTQVLQQARAIPYFENGIPNGYTFVQIEPGSVYDLLGIKNNDVVTDINGDAINDPAKAMQLLSELKSTKHVEIKIKRGGRPMTVNYDIK